MYGCLSVLRIKLPFICRKFHQHIYPKMLMVWQIIHIYRYSDGCDVIELVKISSNPIKMHFLKNFVHFKKKMHRTILKNVTHLTQQLPFFHTLRRSQKDNHEIFTTKKIQNDCGRLENVFLSFQSLFSKKQNKFRFVFKP